MFKEACEKLERYLKLDTYPIAIKVLKSLEGIPEGFKSPRKDLGVRMATCQAIGMVRRQGISLVFTPEDSNCPAGSIVLGFGPPVGFYLEGGICEGIYTETKEAGRASEEAVARFPYGEYKAILISPLQETLFLPDVIVIYGNPAQIMRLVHAACYKRGGALSSYVSGRLDCSEEIVRPYQKKEPFFVLPCNGDRVLGGTQDHEVAISLPSQLLEEILYGLEKTNENGLRYPIKSYLTFEALFPPPYRRLMEMISKVC